MSGRLNVALAVAAGISSVPFMFSLGFMFGEALRRFSWGLR